MVQTLTIGSNTRRANRRKRQILRAAARTFRRKGFHGAAMADIAGDLEMTKGNLYYYFRNKQEILYFCQNESLDHLLRSARAIVRQRRPADAKLRALVAEQVRCMLDELYGAGAHLEVDALDAVRYRQIVRKRDAYEKLLRGVIAEGVRRGAFRQIDAKLAGLAILGAVNWSARWYRPDGGATAETIADTFAEYLVQGLLK